MEQDESVNLNIQRSTRTSHFLGEEEVDKGLSLLHDHNIFQHGDQCPIEPFNLKSEREDGDGYFDGDTYVFRRKRNIDEEEDAWLQQMEDEGTTLRTIAKTDGFQSVEKKQHQRGSLEDRLRREQDDKKSKEEIYREIAELMANDDETVLQAISRVGNIIKNERKRKRVSNILLSKDTLIHSDSFIQVSTMSSAQSALNRLTELTNTCMMRFDDGAKIFELTKLDLHPSLHTNNITFNIDSRSKYFDTDQSLHDESLKDQSVVCDPVPVECRKGVWWEYRGNEDDKVHGPFSTEQMLSWVQAGYFVGDSTVDVRMIHVVDSDKKDTRDNNANMQDLLGDLDDFDPNEQPSDSYRNNEWRRSNAVNFREYF
jgi:CD2 antigen cytoplasmic tail-binding protein 2